MKNKKMLIIGGTSSLAPEIIKRSVKDFDEIVCTYRNKKNIFTNLVIWEYLDLEKDDSIKLFLNKNNKKYDKIIVLIGSVNNKKYSEMSLESIKKYYSIYSGALLFLLQNLTTMINSTGQIIVMSSRSANNPSFDIHYSGTKSSIQAVVRSISKFLKKDQSIVCIAPSLILNSKMFKDMNKKNIKKHIKLSNNNLISKNEIAEFIVSLNNKITKLINGQTISIGNY
jgi:NADP-dependent 3-hydroxy acid dehydrogenase YdfG